MKVKIDKEFLLKHRFWVTLGVAVLIILIGFGWLQVAVDADSEIKKDQTAMGLAKGLIPPFHNAKSIAVKEKAAKDAQELEKKVWVDAYQKQDKIFTFAPEVEKEFDFLNGRFVNKIEINAALDVKNPKAWPPRSEFLIHGILSDPQPTGFALKDDKGLIKDDKGVPLKFYVTKTMIAAGPGQPKIPFDQLSKLAQGKVVAVTYQTGHYFNDALTDEEQKLFSETYKSQIHEILASVDPLDNNNDGVVQLRGWRFRKDAFPDKEASFIRYVAKDWDRVNDISQEAWIAQENLWIQKEIYRIIGATNKSMSAFELQPRKDKKQPYVFRNAAFELVLSLDDKKSLSFTIKNLQAKKQKLDLNFRVKMHPQIPAEKINVSGKELEKKGDKGDTFVTTSDGKDKERTGVFAVEQVLTWETAAIRRIDQVSIGSSAEISHSHRTFIDGLRPLELPPEGAGPGPGVQPLPGPKPKILPGPMIKGKGPNKKGGGLVGGADKVMLAHELWTERYYKVTDQSRRVPVGIVLIVDQAYVDRILTEFNNSKLRFLMTQVLLNQYNDPESMQPPPMETKADPADPAPMPMPMPGIKGFRPRPPVVPGNVPDPNATASAQGSGIHMELVIYGIMTLYQRYPPRHWLEKKVQ